MPNMIYQFNLLRAHFRGGLTRSSMAKLQCEHVAVRHQQTVFFLNYCIKLCFWSLYRRHISNLGEHWQRNDFLTSEADVNSTFAWFLHIWKASRKLCSRDKSFKFDFRDCEVFVGEVSWYNFFECKYSFCPVRNASDRFSQIGTRNLKGKWDGQASKIQLAFWEHHRRRQDAARVLQSTQPFIWQGLGSRVGLGLT